MKQNEITLKERRKIAYGIDGRKDARKKGREEGRKIAHEMIE